MKNLNCPMCGSHIDLQRFLRPRFILCACGARLKLRTGIIVSVGGVVFLMGLLGGMLLTGLGIERHLSTIGMVAVVSAGTGIAALGLHAAARWVDAPFTSAGR